MSSSFGRDVIEEVESGSGSGDWGTDGGLPDDDEDRLNGYDTGKWLVFIGLVGRRKQGSFILLRVFGSGFACVVVENCSTETLYRSKRLAFMLFQAII